MTAVRAVLGRALRLEEDDAPAAARSRRDWIVDSGLFICAAVLAIASGVTSARQGVARSAVRRRRDRRGGVLPGPVVAAAMAARTRARFGTGPRRFALGRGSRRDHPLYRRCLPSLAAGVPGRRDTGRAAAAQAYDPHPRHLA